MAACIVCGTSPARYGKVCGAACDQVMGSPEDFTLLWVFLLVVVAVIVATVYGVIH